MAKRSKAKKAETTKGQICAAHAGGTIDGSGYCDKWPAPGGPCVASGKRLVRNLMSGRMVEEAADTPFTCSVASESYWCN